MSRLRTLFDPRGIAGQIAILIVLAVVVVHAVFFGIVVVRRPADPATVGRPLHDRFATVLRLVDRAKAGAARDAALAAADAAFPTFRLRLDPAAPAGAAGEPLQVVDYIRQQSGVRALDVAAARPEGPDPDLSALAVTLSDGARLSAALDLRRGRPPEVSVVLLGALVFIAVTVSLLSLWAARALTSPLTRFAAAARDFSLDTASPPLPEDGPREVRTAARALNRMHARIRRLVDDRTRMLAAISHDLRTPVTRLRLRAEFVADEAVRLPMLRDLDQMDAMTSGALSFLSPGQPEAGTARVDVSALLSTIADDFSGTGRDVAFTGPDRLAVPGRADELMRAVTNLVENAVRYADRARITLRAFSGVVEIDVEDDGPGIPGAERAAMMRPFARGDAARTIDDAAGFGLGLSIARSVAERHGGRLSLLDAEPHGLLARITLPRTPEAGAAPAELPAIAAE